MPQLIASAQVTLSHLNDAIIAGQPPASPTQGALWIDTNVSPNVLKSWTLGGVAGLGTTTEGDWLAQGLSLEGLDPEKSEEIIRNSEKLADMADDAKITQVERATIKEKLNLITGDDLRPTSDLRTAAEMDAAESGEFYHLRKQAVTVGLSVSHPDYTDLATKWFNLRTYLYGVNPRVWNTQDETTITVFASDWLRYWRDYYESVLRLSNTIAAKLRERSTRFKVRYIRDWLNGSTANAGNHWVEIRAMAGGTNRALNAPVTTNSTQLTNLVRVTDGNIDSANYYGAEDGKLCNVQINLGAVYEDIDYIQVYHYSLDGRTYNATKTEVSEDGTNWVTLFDSAVSGKYKETADGFTVLVNSGSAFYGAQKAADAANALLADIANDNKLTPTEKHDVKREWEIIVSEKPTLDGQADTYAITTEKTNLTNAYNALNTYVTPLITNLTTTTDIVSATFNANFKAYYDAKTALIRKVTDETLKRVNDIKIGGRNLFLNSAFRKDRTNWNVGTLDTVNTYLGFNSVKLTRGSVFVQQVGTRLKPNTTYTLSCYAKYEGVTGSGELGLFGEGGFTGGYSYLPIADTGWTRFTKTLTTSASFTSLTAGWYFHGNYTAGTVWVTAFKLEEGNKATDWTEAPEDIRDDLNLISPLPTNLLLDENGITATTNTDPNAYARLDHRGLYIKGGAIQIEAGLPANQVNLEVSARNLVTKSRFDYLPSGFPGTSTFYELVTDPLHGQVLHVNAQWVHGGELSAIQEYKVGDILNVTFYAKASASSTLTFAFNDGTAAATTTGATIGTTWGNYTGKATITRLGSGRMGFYIYPSATGVEYWIKSVMVQKGDRVTDWTAAPEDTTTAITDAVTNLEVGGRNLARYSGRGYYNLNGIYVEDKPDVVFGTYDGREAGMVTPGSTFRLGYVGGLEVGQEYTWSMYIKGTTDLNMTWSHWDGTSYGTFNFSLTDKWAKYEQTFTAKGPSEILHIGGTTDGVVWYIADWKLEKGNKSTDWTPAIEDVQEAVTKAQTDATAANNLLADIANDNKLTAVEKQDVKKEWDIIVGEKPLLDAQADSYAITTEKTTLTNAYNTLNTYVTPLIANLSTTSDIVGTTFRANFKAYYDAKTNLLKKITDTAKLRTDNIQFAGRNFALRTRKNFLDTAINASVNYTVSEDLKTMMRGKKVTISAYMEGVFVTSTSPHYGVDMQVNFADGTTQWLGVNRGDVPESPAGTIVGKVYSVTDTIPDKEITSITSLTYFIRGMSTVTKYVIKNVKVELGDIPTSWTPAPEDAQDDADTANALLADIASDNKLTANEKQDTQKEWNIITGEKTNIEAQADLYAITTEKTAYTNAYNALNTYLTPLLASLTTTSDIVGTTFRANFKTYYDAKIALLKVVDDRAKAAIDGIQVGGRNLLIKSDKLVSTGGKGAGITPSIDTDGSLKIVTTAGNENYLAGIVSTYGDLENQFAEGEDVTVSFWAKSTDPKPLSFFFKNGMGYFGTSQPMTSTYARVSVTTKWKKANSLNFHLGFSAIVGTTNILRMKIEKGTRATDWTPAIEDTQEAITAAQTAANTANNLLADIANDDKLTATEKQDTKKEWDTIVGEKANIDAQADLYAITIEKTAYGNAYGALGTYIGPLISTLTTTSDIVGTTFRANFKAYYDAREALLKKVAEEAKKRMDGITVGGRNLILNSGNYLADVGPWVKNSTGTLTLDTVNKYAGANTLRTTGNDGFSHIDWIELKPNTDYTYSVMAKASATVTGGSSTPLHMWVNSTKTTAHLEIIQAQNASIGTDWTKAWIHFKTPVGASIYYMKPFIYGFSSATVNVANFKLEEGNRATDWTEAPEDAIERDGINQWHTQKYSVNLGSSAIIPTYAHIKGRAPTATKVVKDSTANFVTATGFGGGDYYIIKLTTNLYVSQDKTITFGVQSDDGSNFYVNGISQATVASNAAAVNITLNLKAGWNQLDILLYEHQGADALTITTAISTLVERMSYRLGGTSNYVENYVAGVDAILRDDLQLEAPLPTSLKMNAEGITAYTSDPEKYARLDYRGLYIKGGALQIEGGIGSKNLIKNSEELPISGLSGGTSILKNNQTAPDRSQTAHTLKTTTNGSNFRIHNVVPNNGTFTFSVWMRSATSNGAAGLGMTDTGNITVEIDLCDKPSHTFTVTPDWQLFSGTTTVNNWSANIYNFVDIYLSANREVDVWHPMLVSGSVATDWTPAPDDMVNVNKDYNGVHIDGTSGLQITSAKNTLTLNATKGLEVIKNVDGSKVLYLDSSTGVMYANGLVIDGGSTLNGLPASTVTAGTASGGDSSIINLNPTFLNWVDTYPATWKADNGVAPRRVVSDNGTGYAVEYVVPASTETYFNQDVSVNPYYQYIYVEATFKLVSGTIDGAGILFRHYQSNGTSILKDSHLNFKTAVPTPQLGKWYTVSQIFKATDVTTTNFSRYRVYVMGGWSVLAPITAKTIQFDSVKARPATAQEIKQFDNEAGWDKGATSVQTNFDYNGVKIEGTNGLTITSTRNTLTLNASKGLEIKRTSDSANIFNLNATTGDLAVTGNITMTTGSTLSGDYINAGTVSADRIDVRAKNLIANFSRTGNLTGWISGVNVSATFVQDTERGLVLDSKSKGGPSTYETLRFDVDPNKTYKFSVSGKFGLAADGVTPANPSGGRQYVGFYCYDDVGSLIGAYAFDPVARTFSGTANANPYFWNDTVTWTGWRDFEAIIIAANITDPKEVPEGKNVTSHFKMHPKTRRVGVRVYNGYYPTDTTQTTTFYWYSPAVTSIDAGSITANQIKVNTLSAITANVGNLTAGTIDAATLTINNINASNIKSGTISGTYIAADAITADHINVSNLAAIHSDLGSLTAGTIDASKVTIQNLTAAHIVTGTFSADRITIGAATTFAAGYNPVLATSLDEMTKKTGTEMLNLEYKSTLTPIVMPFTAASGSYVIVAATDLAGANANEQNLLKTTNATFLYSEYIPFDAASPHYVTMDVYNVATNVGTVYAQVCYYDASKVALATNEAAVSAISDKANTAADTWQTHVGYLAPLSTTDIRQKAVYVRIRFLTRYNAQPGVTYLRNLSWKTLAPAHVAAAQSTLTKWRYANTTFIDGGNIYANTVTANMLATNTITASSGVIANAAITNGMIESLNAGKITAGQLSVHAQQLAKGTNFGKPLELYGISGGLSVTTSTDAVSGGTYLILEQSGTTELFAYGKRFAIEADREVTLSLEYFNDANALGFDVFALTSTSVLDETNIQSTGYSGASIFVNHTHMFTDKGSGWRQVQRTFTVQANTKSAILRFDHNGVTAAGTAGKVRIRNVMLNYGKVAAAWQPHTDEDISVGAITADKIAAGSITADKITAGTITADKIVMGDFTNLFENPDFEGDAVGSVPKGLTLPTGTVGAARTANISAWTGSAGNGSNRALEIDAGSGINRDVYATNIIPVTPGQKFYLYAEGRYLNTAGTGYGTIGFRHYDAKKIAMSAWTSVANWGSTTKEQVFTKKDGTFTVPDGVYGLQMWTSFMNNTETTNKFYIDNIRIHRGVMPEFITNGSITAEKINVKGLNVTNAGGTTTFGVSTNGDVSINGNITMTGGSISWTNVTAPTAAQVGARPNTWMPSAADVGGVAKTQTDVFNTLTNNGASQGLFLSNGLLYVNASFINGGTIRGVTIEVTTDLTVGNNIILGGVGHGMAGDKAIKWTDDAWIYSQGDFSLTIDTSTLYLLGTVKIPSALDLSTTTVTYGTSSRPTAKFG